METSTRRVVVALAAALGLALLTIAFLLGRLSAPPGMAAVPSAPAEDSPRSNPSPTTPSTPIEPPASPASTSTSVEADSRPPGTRADDSRGVSATPIDPPPPLPARTAAAPQSSVALYFAEIDRLEDMGAGDPQAFASSMMPALSSGDFTAFDDLLAKARSQRQRLQSVAPPPACVEHHRLALALSSDAVLLLERLKGALMKGDSLALVSIASEGRDLEAKAAQLKSMGETIKKTTRL